MSEAKNITLKDLAFELNISQEKLKGISVQLFEAVLRVFTPEQVNTIKDSLTVVTGNTFDVKALAQTVQSNVPAEMVQSMPINVLTENVTQLQEQPGKVVKIKEILGTSTISKNVAYWQQLSFIRIKKALAEQEKMLLAFRVASNDQVTQTFKDLTDDVRNNFTLIRRDWFTSMTGDLTHELQALSKMEVELTESNSIYEQNIRDAVDELMTLG